MPVFCKKNTSNTSVWPLLVELLAWCCCSQRVLLSIQILVLSVQVTIASGNKLKSSFFGSLFGSQYALIIRIFCLSLISTSTVTSSMFSLRYRSSSWCFTLIHNSPWPSFWSIWGICSSKHWSYLLLSSSPVFSMVATPMLCYLGAVPGHSSYSSARWRSDVEVHLSYMNTIRNSFIWVMGVVNSIIFPVV